MYCGSQCGRNLASGTPQRPSGLLLLGCCAHTAGSYICALPMAIHARPTVFVAACISEARKQMQVMIGHCAVSGSVIYSRSLP